MTQMLSIALAAILTSNFVLGQCLGVCAFVRASKSMETAAGSGMAVTFVMTLASAAAWLVHTYVLAPLGLEFLQIIVWVMLLVALVQLLDIGMERSLPALHRALGGMQPLLLTNCAVLGAAILSVTKGYDLLGAVTYALAGGLGYLLVTCMLASLCDQLAVTARCPRCFQGLPIVLVAASLLALAFTGFGGLKIG